MATRPFLFFASLQTPTIAKENICGGALFGPLEKVEMQSILFCFYNAIETVRKRRGDGRDRKEKKCRETCAGRRPTGAEWAAMEKKEKKYTEAPKCGAKARHRRARPRSRGQEVDPRHDVNVIGLGDVRGVDACHEKGVDGQGVKEALR